jgi:hypothetical protein
VRLRGTASSSSSATAKCRTKRQCPEIDGTVFVSKIWDDHDQNLLPSLGSPSMDWNGGGNGIHYNHCWVET